MSDRHFVAAVLYPVCQASLMGIGIVATTTLPHGQDQVPSLARIVIASLVPSAPLSFAMAPLLLSARERRKLP